MAVHGSVLARRLQPRSPAETHNEEVKPSSLGRSGRQASPSPTLLRPWAADIIVHNASNGEELAQDVATSAEKLWSQYSQRMPRCNINGTPGRTPRSVSSTTPRSYCTSARSLTSLPDLHTQAVASNKHLETELAVMSGLIAEVSSRAAAADPSLSARSPSSSSTTSPNALIPSLNSTSPRQAKAVQGEPAAAEAAHGRRKSAPVGARYRPQKRDEFTQHLEEVQAMHRRISMALTSTENLISGLQDLRAQRHRKAGDGDSRPSLSPRSTATRSSSRREAAQSRPDTRMSALQRSLCIRMKDSEDLCKEAQGVSARVLHALTLAREAAAVKLVLTNGNTSRGAHQRTTFSPPSRRRTGSP